MTIMSISSASIKVTAFLMLKTYIIPKQKKNLRKYFSFSFCSYFGYLFGMNCNGRREFKLNNRRTKNQF